MKNLLNLFISFMLLTNISCVSNKEFSKKHDIEKPVDYTDQIVQGYFQIGEIYKIKSKSDQVFLITLSQVTETSIIGYQLDSKDNQVIEIPFENIAQVKIKEYNRAGNIARVTLPIIAVFGLVLVAGAIFGVFKMVE